MNKKILLFLCFFSILILFVACKNITNNTNDSDSDSTATPIIATTAAVIISENPSVIPTLEPTLEPTVKPTVEPTNAPIQDKPLAGLKICIDPGHQIKGNYDKELCAPWSDTLKSKCTSGTAGNFTGTAEYVINLMISQKIKDKLVSNGAEVLMVRENHEVDISNKERAEMANEFGADITLRIHCNSASSSKAEGIDLYVRDIGDGSTEYKAKSDKDYAIATHMLECICESTGAKKRYVNRSDNYTGINWCDNTCIIVECGFMSNEKEDKLLNTDEYQDKIAQGILNYFLSI